MNHAVVAFDVARPARGLGRTLGLQADDRVVEPVLAELEVGSQLAAVEGVLVGVEAIHVSLARDDVVLKDRLVNGRADLALVLFNGSVGRGGQGEVAGRDRLGEASGGDGRGELAEVVLGGTRE